MASTRNRIAAVAAGAVIAGGGVAGGYIAHGASGDGGGTVTVSAASSSSAQPAANTPTRSVNQIYRSARNGVVEVIATQQSSSSPFPGGRGGGSSAAQGSGFVYDASGRIVTNQHVVDGATSVTVRFSSGKELRAQVVGTDPSTDLAVLKVDSLPGGVAPLALGDSGSLQVGDGVVAIGSPFGLEETVTTGIVSALGREIQSPNNYAIAGAIQTDAAINHGNSGGPLLDLSGKVIGVNSQIESDSGGNDGVGFAIPSSTVKTIAERLISDGRVEHAFLGVSPADAVGGGARLAQISPGTPASRAGLRAGDVVTSFDGDEIADADALRAAVDARRVGEKVELKVRRDGETKTLEVTLGTRPAA
jgi:putative serine protease PepD